MTDTTVSNSTTTAVEESADEWMTIQRQLFVDLAKELKEDGDHSSLETLRDLVHKNLRNGHKVNDKCIDLFRKQVVQRVDETLNDIKLNENYLLNERLMNETFDNIIEKQMKIKEINDSMVEKTMALNAIQSEESHTKLMKDVLTADDNHLNYNTINTQLITNDCQKSGTKQS